MKPKNEGGDRITGKQKRFADIYVKCQDAAEAYAQAYGTKDMKAAINGGARLLKITEVQEYIKKKDEEMRGSTKVEGEKLLELLTAIAFTSPADFASITTEGGKQKIVWQDIAALPEDVKKAVAVIKNTPSGIVVETLDRMKAIDLLMKYTGIQKDGDGGVVIEGSIE